MKLATNHKLVFFGLLISVSFLAIANKAKDHNLSYEPALTLIEELQNGESFSIEITSIGCFNGTRQTIQITKKEDIITASLKEKSRVLTTADIEVLKIFEHQLRDLKPGGCSTVDTYVLSFGDSSYHTSDGTCSWHGYRSLLKIFD